LNFEKGEGWGNEDTKEEVELSGQEEKWNVKCDGELREGGKLEKQRRNGNRQGGG
jgi:hypothetical protein